MGEKRESEIGREKFDEIKTLLMADWLDTHPNCTRVDFRKYFDRRVELSAHRKAWS